MKTKCRDIPKYVSQCTYDRANLTQKRTCTFITKDAKCFANMSSAKHHLFEPPHKTIDTD